MEGLINLLYKWIGEFGQPSSPIFVYRSLYYSHIGFKTRYLEIGKLNNICNDYVNVHMDLGTLKISQNESAIIMEGPAMKICEGIYDYEENHEN